MKTKVDVSEIECLARGDSQCSFEATKTKG